MGIVYACAVPHPPLIIPAVGRGMELRIPDTVRAYEQVARETAEAKPEVVVLLTSHAPAFRDCFYVSEGGAAIASMARFDVPEESFSVLCDGPLSAAIAEGARAAGIPVTRDDPYAGRGGAARARRSSRAGGGAGDGGLAQLDHASFIPLWFLRRALAQDAEAPGAEAPDAEAHATAGGAGAEGAGAGNRSSSLPPIVRIGLSGLPLRTHWELGRVVARAMQADGRRAAVVASGDLSHRLLAEGPYGFRPEGPIFDEQVTRIFARGALDELLSIDEDLAEAAGECGWRPFSILAGILSGHAFEARLLSYEGPFGVGYAVASFALA